MDNIKIKIIFIVGMQAQSTKLNSKLTPKDQLNNSTFRRPSKKGVGQQQDNEATEKIKMVEKLKIAARKAFAVSITQKIDCIENNKAFY